MGEEPGILLRLSDEVGLTPALLARSIVERHYQRQDKSSNLNSNKNFLIKNLMVFCSFRTS